MRVSCICCLSILLALGFAQCSRSSRSAQPNEFHNIMSDLSPTEFELCNASAEFGFELFKQIQKEEDSGKNLFISPISISYCLGMLYNGATGETREEIAKALQVSGFTEQEINEGYKHIAYQLPLVDPSVEFLLANSAWAQIGYPFYPAFVDICTHYFNAEMFDIDFNLSSAADIINQWAADHTKGLIDKIVSADDLMGMLWAVMNAVYFKGDWSQKFVADATYEGVFHLEDTTAVSCFMMWNEATFDYLENDLFQAVNLPYGQGAYSMAVILPQPKIGVDELIGSLTKEDWEVWSNGMQPKTVKLKMPRFKFAYKTEDDLLPKALMNLGMVKAFGPFAEFDNVMESNTAIGILRHASFVRVDEEGTEAAAVTFMGNLGSSPPSKSMIVDRPFIFIIHEKATGTILFMGRVCDPVWE